MHSLLLPIFLSSSLFLPTLTLAHPHVHPGSDASFVSTMPAKAQSLFTESMTWMDDFYDIDAGYLYNFESAALRHETRSSAWYATGLLARNGNRGGDAREANKIIENVIKGQYRVQSEQWYGDYQKEPEELYVGSKYYTPNIYNSWDPNWRGFIGTVFIMCLEEFPNLITPKVTALMLDSLHNATVGDSYRVGGVDNDNLYPAYSNPSLMRAFVSGWTGRRLNDANMTTAGENYAQAIITLFNRANTLSEFNSGTYTGVSLFALTLWAKYLPADSIMQQYGPKMIKYTWESVAQLWHPQLLNVAGPWDRSYGFDMNRYLSILALNIWTLIGKEKSSIIAKGQTMSHSADFAFGPLTAILASFHQTLVPAAVVSALGSFIGEHTMTSSTFSPPYDTYPRNITAWLADGISIGAESFAEKAVGGPALDPNSFNPAVVQWDTGNGVGFISLHPTENSMIATASKNALNLTLPLGTNASIFTFTVSPFKDKIEIAGWEDVQGLDVKVSGSVNLTYALSYAGMYGGSSSLIRDFEFWNFTYSMPAGSKEVPHILLELTMK